MTTSDSAEDQRPTRRWRHLLPSPIEAHPADCLLTPERAETFRQVLARRTERLAVVVEDCHDPHNATAVVRSCDIFGVHRVHVTTGRSRFKVNRRVSQGAHRYVDLNVHADITEAYAALRKDGFKILVSDLHADAVVGPQSLAENLAEQPLALVFGSEGYGVSQAASEQADGFFLIPMAGFSQSLNLSVSVATTVYSLRALALTADAPGDMSAERQRAWYDSWLRAQKGEAVDRCVAAVGDGWVPPPDPRARLEVDKRGDELETFGTD
ncbi:MAG: RNA methyltransferase [Planctomycetota bacterium]|nr:RNA methyltransferase [Planctomycetota bacterium]